MIRILSILALVAVVLAGAPVNAPAFAQGEQTIVHAQGNPYLGDFQTLSNKRSDLRINVGRKGLNAAFSDWLRSERPVAYRQALSSNKVASVAKAASSCCKERASCCSRQNACCSDKNNGCKDNCCSGKACCS